MLSCFHLAASVLMTVMFLIVQLIKYAIIYKNVFQTSKKNLKFQIFYVEVKVLKKDSPAQIHSHFLPAGSALTPQQTPPNCKESFLSTLISPGATGCSGLQSQTQEKNISFQKAHSLKAGPLVNTNVYIKYIM